MGNVKLSMFDGNADTPFTFGRGEGVDEGSMDTDKWIVEKMKPVYDKTFYDLEPNEDGKISGSAAKSIMVQSKLQNSVLAKIWKLADHDNDGMLNDQEFALAMHLIDVKKNGHDIPGELPKHLIPPCFRLNSPTKNHTSNSHES